MKFLRGVEALNARAEPLIQRIPDNGVVVEVGVYRGDLGRLILTRRSDVTWYGIDPWRAENDQPKTYVETRDPHSRLSLQIQNALYRAANEAVSKFADRATIHRLPSVEGAALFEDNALDLVFLDGDHSYSGVTADIEAWWPKVKSGGLLGGHDWCNPNPAYKLGVEQAVRDWIDQTGFDLVLDDGMTWWVRRPS